MEAIQIRPTARVEEVNDGARFAALEEEWNALVRETDDQLFFRHEFVRIWLEHFARDARIRVLLARDAEGRLTGALPLIEERATMYGVPVRQLVSASNAHSCRFDLIARDPTDAGESFFQFLAKDEEWDLIRLNDVPEGGRALALHRAAEQAGWPVGSWPSLRSPYVSLPKSFEVLQQALGSRFRSSLRRRRRRLAELGRVEVLRVSGPEDLDVYLERAYEIERSGWKGQNGTAIVQDARTLGFYTKLAHFAASAGALSLFFLLLDRKAIAFDLAMTYAGRYLTLKPGYDEAYAPYSPGQLLTESSLQDAIERGLTEFDLLGDDLPCKRDWTDRVRPHAWLFVFRNNGLGRLLRATKFKMAPTAKEVVARLRG